MSTASSKQRVSLDRSALLRLVQVFLFVLLLGALLFGAAGRLDWWEAWAFLALFILMMLAASIWSLRNNPGLLGERSRMAANTKRWDKIILAFYTVLLLAMMLAAGFDARFGWSAVPLWVQLLGGAGLVAGMSAVYWVATSNPYLSAVVRIQEDRGHQVVAQGPYRIVRHPMYAASLFLFWSIPLLLGSWWALIPGCLNAIVFVVRTGLEDRTLQAELPGYADYARQVRYRLIPGLW